MDVKIKYLPVPPTAILPTTNYSPKRNVQRVADQRKYKAEKDLDYKKLIDPEFNYKKTYSEFEHWCSIEWIATNHNGEGSITKFIRSIASIGEKYSAAHWYYLRWASNAAEENLINEYSLIGDLINEIIFESRATYNKNGELVLPGSEEKVSKVNRETPDVKHRKLFDRAYDQKSKQALIAFFVDCGLIVDEDEHSIQKIGKKGSQAGSKLWAAALVLSTYHKENTSKRLIKGSTTAGSISGSFFTQFNLDPVNLKNRTTTDSFCKTFTTSLNFILDK